MAKNEVPAAQENRNTFLYCSVEVNELCGASRKFWGVTLDVGFRMYVIQCCNEDEAAVIEKMFNDAIGYAREDYDDDAMIELTANVIHYRAEDYGVIISDNLSNVVVGRSFDQNLTQAEIVCDTATKFVTIINDALNE